MLHETLDWRKSQILQFCGETKRELIKGKREN